MDELGHKLNRGGRVQLKGLGSKKGFIRTKNIEEFYTENQINYIPTYFITKRKKVYTDIKIYKNIPI